MNPHWVDVAPRRASNQDIFLDEAFPGARSLAARKDCRDQTALESCYRDRPYVPQSPRAYSSILGSVVVPNGRLVWAGPATFGNSEHSQLIGQQRQPILYATPVDGSSTSKPTPGRWSDQDAEPASTLIRRTFQKDMQPAMQRPLLRRSSAGPMLGNHLNHWGTPRI
jgi:hypothetical protein